MNYMKEDYRVFEMFADGRAVATAGDIDDYNC